MSVIIPGFLSNKGLTRRTVLGGAAAIGGSALHGGLPAFAQAKPKRGGTLTIAFTGPPDSLDPHGTLAFSGFQVSSLIFDNLTALDENRRAVPMLATRWQPEKNGQEWVFELREGVKFHHGRELTSEDVVASVERSQDKSLGLNSIGYWGPYQAVKAEGKYKVRIILTQPFAELPVLAAGRWTRIVPADKLNSLKTEPVGSGPFLFKDFQPNAGVTVVRNPNYWMPEIPYLDEIKIVAIRESIAQQAALRGGSVDIVTQIPIEAYLGLQNVSGVRTYSLINGQYQAVMTQANMPPFDNPKVREAFKYLLDRKALVSSALLGQGDIGNDFPVLPGYSASPPQHAQDLVKAKALLDEAKVGPLTLDMYVLSERPPTPKLGLALQEAAAKVGVTINLRDIPFTEYAANVSRKKPLYTVQWAAYPTLYETIYLMYRSGAPRNYGGVENGPGLDALLDAMIAELDDNKRKVIAAQAMEKIHANGERVIPYFNKYFAATAERVQGFVPPQIDVIEMRSMWLSS